MHTIQSSYRNPWQIQMGFFSKLKAVALSLIFAVGLAACGSGSNSSTSTVPSAPMIGTVVGGNAQATVSFAAPASNGGSAITGYTVTSIPAGGVDSNAGSTALIHTITGLTNGTSYTFKVVATNAVGSSAASAASSAVTPTAPAAPTVPGAPTIGAATAGNAQASVSFVAPANTGNSAITGYTVTSTPAGGVDSNAGTTALTHVITGLTNGTAYTFKVHATNAIGNSIESASSNSVTPTLSVAYASGFNITAGTSTDGGTLGAYTWAANGGAQFSGGDAAALTNSTYWYAGYNFTAAPAAGDGFGAFVAAPGVVAAGGVDSGNGLVVTNATNLVIPISVAQEMWTSKTGALTLHIIAQGKANKYPANCTVLVSTDLTVTAQAMTTYTIPMSSFTLGQACAQAGITNVATALADGIAEIHVQALTGNLNTTVLTGGFYPNAVTLGAPIAFEVSTPVAATAPSAPTAVVAAGGNAQATVSYAAAANGGSAITGYTVTSIPAGGVDSNAGTTSLSHTITGLNNGTSYTFTVVATNAIGSSTASMASNAVTPAVVVGQVSSTAGNWALGGANDWNGATSSLVTSQPVGGGQANAAMVVVAPASQYFGTTFLTLANEEFCTTANPTISVEVYAPVAAKVRLKLEQDGSTPNNIEMDATTVVGWQTLTYNCLTSSGNATTPPTAQYVEGTVYNKASILFNFNTAAANPGETWYFDRVTYTPTAAVTYVPPAPAVDPTVKPAAPTALLANVISIFGTTYGDMVGVGVNPNWGQSTVVTTINVAGDNVLKYANLNYQGMDLSPATGIDVSTKTNLHIDVWAASATAFDVFLISPGPLEQAVTLNPTQAGWNSFDIPLSSYTVPNKAAIFQFKFVGAPAGNTVYIDNLYFW